MDDKVESRRAYLPQMNDMDYTDDYIDYTADYIAYTVEVSGVQVQWGAFKSVRLNIVFADSKI